MKKLVVLTAAILVAIPAVAWATTTTTVHFSGSDPPQETNGCNGNGPFVWTIGPYSGVMHETDNGDGTYHFTLVPEVAGLPTYTGHFAFWDGHNQNQKNMTDTSTFPNQLKGSDGSKMNVVNTIHASISASGQPVVSFDVFKCHQQ